MSRLRPYYHNVVSITKMEIQSLQQNDLQFLARLQPIDWVDIMPHHQFYLQSRFCCPVKVMFENEIAGIGTAIQHNEIAWLAHIIVAPEYRNKGLGKLITEYLVQHAYAQKCETIYLIATELGAPVYEKIGFQTECEYVGFKDGKVEEVNQESLNVVAYAENYKQQVVNMDRSISGENRFFRIEQHLRDGFLYVKNGRVKGYYLPGFGEGLVNATSAEAGVALLKLRLSKNNNVRFPMVNKAAFDFFKTNNYTQYIAQKRMILGEPRTWQPENLYSRTGGQVG
jgi:GNAT superfamily N-acetyltransferase